MCYDIRAHGGHFGKWLPHLDGDLGGPLDQGQIIKGKPRFRWYPDRQTFYSSWVQSSCIDAVLDIMTSDFG